MMNKTPGVSVIIPTLNRPKLVIRCVESIYNQTFKGKINCIVVDSSDNDKTELAIKNFNEFQGFFALINRVILLFLEDLSLAW